MQKKPVLCEPLWLFTVVFMTINVITFIAVCQNPANFGVLCCSMQTPWGVLTSCFIHANFEHLVINLVGMLNATLVFALLNMWCTSKERIEKGFFFAASVTICGVLANVMLLSLYPLSNSLGSSGIGFTALGIVYAQAIANLAIAPRKKQTQPKRRIICVVIYSIAIVATFSPLLLFCPAQFFSITFGINYPVHIMGFVSGAIISLIFEASLATRNSVS